MILDMDNGSKVLLMRQKKRCLSALSAFLLMFILVQYGMSETEKPIPNELSLNQSVDYALNHNTDIKTQEAVIKAALAQSIQAKSNWLLQLSLNAQMDYYKNSNATITPGIDGNDLYTYLQATQPVLTFGKYKNTINSSQAALDNQIILLKDSRQTVCYNVTMAYYNVLLQDKIVKVNEDAVKTAADHLNDAELRFKQGLNTKFDVTRSKVDLANRKADLITAQTDYEKARQSFNQLLNIDPQVKIHLNGTLSYVEYNPDSVALWKMTQENRPQLISKQILIKQNAFLLNLRKAAYYPTVYLSGEYNLEHTSYEDHSDRNFNQWTAFLRFSLPLYDGHMISGQIKEAKSILEQSQLALQKETLNAKTELEQALLDIQKQKEMVQTNQSTIELAELSLNMAKLSYENGKATTLDVSDAELSLRTARNNLAKAINDYLVALAKLKQVIGLDELPR